MSSYGDPPLSGIAPTTDGRRATAIEMNALRVNRYHPFLVSLHWAVALLTLAALFFGAMILAHIPNRAPYKIPGLSKHMIVGTAVLVLVLVRLLVRRATTLPPTASAGNTFLDKATRVLRGLLYATLICQALTGLTLAYQARLFTVAGPLFLKR